MPGLQGRQREKENDGRVIWGRTECTQLVGNKKIQSVSSDPSNNTRFVVCFFTQRCLLFFQQCSSNKMVSFGGLVSSDARD